MPMRVMVAGAIAQHPLGVSGNTWAFLQYVLGFRRLGFDTYYVEHIDTERCIDVEWTRAPFATSANADHFRRVMEQFQLSDHAALLEFNGEGHVGLTRRDLERRARETDLF